MEFEPHIDALVENAQIALQEAFEGFTVDIYRRKAADFGTTDFEAVEDEVAARIAKAMIPRKIMQEYYCQLGATDAENEDRWQEMQEDLHRQQEYTEASDPAMPE